MLLNFLKEAVPWEGVTLGCWVCPLTFQPCPADTAPTLVSTDSHCWIADSWGGRSASPWPCWHLHIKNRAPIHPTLLPLNGGVVRSVFHWSCCPQEGGKWWTQAQTALLLQAGVRSLTLHWGPQTPGGGRWGEQHVNQSHSHHLLVPPEVGAQQPTKSATHADNGGAVCRNRSVVGLSPNSLFSLIAAGWIGSSAPHCVSKTPGVGRKWNTH